MRWYGGSGKVALVTGATGGIGGATVRLFLEAGASVVATGRDQHRLEEIFREREHVLAI